MNINVSLIAAAVVAMLSTSSALAADTAGEHFIKESIQGNLAEVKVGGLAEQKGNSQGVKDFGATLAKDHAAANDKAKQVAQTMGGTVPDEPAPQQKAMYKEMAALSSQEFDKHFIDSMIKDHKEDIAKYEKEADNGSGPAADYAKQILPDLRKHLQIAERLQKQQKTASAAGHSTLK